MRRKPMTNPFTTFDLWSGLFGGLALFLFGMDVMTKALKAAAGDYMKDVLGQLTRNRFVGMGAGAFVTALIQSSSVTTVLLVGFISAGLMSMSQSVSVIIGANIGTTITAQILAFKVTQLALPIIATGFLTSFAARTNQWRQAGMGLLGLGLLFYGMGIMSAGVAPLRSYPPFIDFMVTMQSPLLGAAIGAGFTAIIQASAATTGILIVLASQGLINLETAIAIALGANIGTCITAGLASIGKPREAVRAAAVHTLFNVAGVLLWIGFIPQLAEFTRWISPTADNLAGAERIAAEMPRQIANVHTFFNVANALLFVGFTTRIAQLVEWLIPDQPIKPQKAMLPKHLDEDLLETPSIALEAVRSELRRLGKRVRRMVREIMPAAIIGTRTDLERVAAMDKAVDALHVGIIDYLGRISLSNLSERQSTELVQLVQVANALEQIGDRIATGLVTSARKRIDEEVTVSPQTATVLNEYHEFVLTAVADAIKAVTSQDSELAKDVRKRRKDFDRLSRDLTEYGLDRLTADEPNRLNTFVREMEVMEIFESVFAIARRIAETQK
jgi:phosphate:Na+ symporter